MKPMIRNSIIATLALAALNTQAYSAETLQPNQQDTLTSFKTVIDLVQKEGYRDIYEIEKEYGFIKIKAHDTNGSRIKLAVIPETETVKVLEQKNTKHGKTYTNVAPQITLDQALNILNAQGYALIEEIGFKRGYYEAEVRDQKGQKQNITLDAQNGEVLPKWKAFFH